MSQEDGHVSARVAREVDERVDKYQERTDKATRTDAVEELLQIGLREAEAPLLYRAKDTALDAAYHLSMVAIVTLVVGFQTTALAPGNAMEIAVIMLTIAAAPVAAVESVKLARAWRVGGGA